MAQALVGKVIVDVFSRNSSMNASDYRKANHFAYSVILCSDQSHLTEPIACPERTDDSFISSSLDSLDLNERRMIESEAERWITDAISLAQSIVLDNFDNLANLVGYLLTERVLNYTQLMDF